MTELLDRDLVRSVEVVRDQALREIGDRLVAGRVAPPNERSYDVVAPGRGRLQVKALRMTNIA